MRGAAPLNRHLGIRPSVQVSCRRCGRGPIVFPLVAANPVVVVVLAHSFLKERLTRTEVLLIGAVIAGIVMASMI